MHLPPFPSAELVTHIPMAQHPLGRYVRARRRMEFSCKELSSRSKAVREFAVFHELGHWWRCERVPDLVIGSDQDEEDFADAFAHFFLQPIKLSPHDRAVVESTLPSDCISAIREFAIGVQGELERALCVVCNHR